MKIKSLLLKFILIDIHSDEDEDDDEENDEEYNEEDDDFEEISSGEENKAFPNCFFFNN